MALLISCTGSPFLKTGVQFSRDLVPSAQRSVQPGARSLRVKAFFNPFNEPILKEAIKEPVAFFGGAFAGLLRLNLNEEPLKDWILRSVEAAGVTEEDIEAGNPQEEEAAPQQIEIE
ncbi:UPF0426 protein At1g28150, chloroplastic [Nymphaea colorata]|nr:UPF0426 protein At1g28150, chloroplastic [Nymphaea colorata]